MNRDNIERYVSIIETFDEMKKRLDPYTTLATLSEAYKTSTEYEPINSTLLVIDKSLKSYLIIIISEIAKYLNSIVTEDENRPSLINVIHDKDNYIIKAGSRILTTFSKNANKDEIMNLIEKLPILERQTIEIHKRIEELFEQFYELIYSHADNVIKYLELPGFQITEHRWDDYNRGCCRFTIRYYNKEVNEIGHLSYSLNFTNENNCKIQFEKMEQKIKAGFMQFLIPKLKF